MRFFKLLFLITSPVYLQAQCATQFSDYFNFAVGDEFELTHEDSPHFQDGPTDGVGITYQYTIMEDISDLEDRKYVVSGIRYDYSIHVYEETIQGVITPWEDTIVYLASTYAYLNHCGDTLNYPFFRGWNFDPDSQESAGVYDKPFGKQIGEHYNYVNARYDTIHGLLRREYLGIGFGYHDTLVCHISGEDTLGQWTARPDFILGSSAGVNDELNIQAFPNPANDFIKVIDLEVDTWTMNSIDGYQVSNGEGNIIETESLPNGLYLLRISTPADLEFRKRVLIER